MENSCKLSDNVASMHQNTEPTLSYFEVAPECTQIKENPFMCLHFVRETYFGRPVPCLGFQIKPYIRETKLAPELRAHLENCPDIAPGEAHYFMSEELKERLAAVKPQLKNPHMYHRDFARFHKYVLGFNSARKHLYEQLSGDCWCAYLRDRFAEPIGPIFCSPEEPTAENFDEEEEKEDKKRDDFRRLVNLCDFTWDEVLDEGTVLCLVMMHGMQDIFYELNSDSTVSVSIVSHPDFV